MDKLIRINRILLFLLFAIPFFGIGQPITLLIDMADKYAEANDHLKAIGVYKAVLERDANNIAGQYKIAESYRAILDYETAQGYYLKVKRRNDGRFPLSGYYYALMTKLNGDYQEALESFEEFMALLKERDQHEDERYRQFYEQARIEREGSLIALNEITIAQPNHQFGLLPEPVNSDAMDSAPATYTNDSTLVISSGRKGGRGAGLGAFGESWNDLYRFSKDEGEWNNVRIRDDFEDINDKYEDAAGMFNHERNKFYFTRCDPTSETVINCAIYVSTLQGGEWSEPVKLNSNINSRGSNSRQSCITFSGDSLFFCSDREGGYGRYDIYLSTKYGDENWGLPQNLGSQINTPFTESSPFYDHKDRTLFFSSDGHRGFGGFDIYLADGTSFEKAEIYNVGAPYNSNKDDLFFFLGDHKGYLSSNRDGGTGKMDIYGFSISTESEIITEIESEQSIAGRNSLFSDDYDFDSDNDEMLSEIISHLMASNVTDVQMALTNEQLSFYNSLSKDDQERIDRIVNARVRNLSQNDLNAIRDEDEFYYSSMKSDDKRHLDNLVSAYVREDGLGLSVSVEQEEEDFYHDLSVEDKEKVDMIIATRMKQAHEYHVPTTVYDGLDAQSQRSVDQLSYKVIGEKKNIGNLALDFNENLFVRNNQDNPGVVNNSVKEKIYNLADDPKYELKEEDHIFYQNLDSRQLEALQNIASSIILHDVDNIEESISKEDHAVYASFSVNQRQQLDRILAKIINNTVKADLYLGEVNFEKTEVAAAKLNRNIEAAFDYLKSNNAPLFNSFSTKNNRAIKRFISVSEPWINSPSNIYLPDGEISEPTDYANRGPLIADVRAGMSPTSKPGSISAAPGSQASASLSVNTALSPDQDLTTTDISIYESLTTDQKGAINRSIAAKVLTNAYSQNASLPVSDNEYFATLNASQQSFVEVLNKHLSGESLTPEEKVRLSSAQSFYQHLPANEKEIMSRIIAKEVLNEYRNVNSYGISQQDQQLIASLSTMEKSGVDKISTYFQIRELINLDINGINAAINQNQDAVADIPADLGNGLSQLNITGRLMDSKSNAPFARTAIKLISRNGVPIQQVTSNSNGSFSFTGVPNTEYQIEISSPGDEHANAYINELTVKGTGILAQNKENPGNSITDDDIRLYEALDPNKKRVIDLSIAAEILNKIYSNDPYQHPTDQQFFKTLSEKEKSYIQILAKDLRGEAIEPGELSLRSTANSYYTHLIPAERPFWSRLIAVEALRDYEKDNQYSLSAEDMAIIASLSYAEKNTYDRILASRSLDAPFFTDQLNADNHYLSDIPGSVTTSNTNISIAGNIEAVKTNIPASDQFLELVNDNNTTVSRTTTNTSGQFEFNNVSAGKYSVKREETNTNSTGVNNLYVNNITVKDSQGTTILGPSANEEMFSDTDLKSSDINFYSNLNEEAKKAIDRSIAAELITEAYRESAQLSTSDAQYLSNLKPGEKEYFETLVKDLSRQNFTGVEQPARAIAYSYWRQLSEPEQKTWNRLVTSEALKAYKSGNTYGISPEDKSIIGGLSDYGITIYNNIKKARAISGPLVERDIVYNDSKDVLLNIPEITNVQGDLLEISGRLNEVKTSDPASSVQLALTDNDGNAISRTTTNANGQFTFDRTEYGNHSIRIIDPEKQTNTDRNVFVSDLTMKNIQTENILTSNQTADDMRPVQLTLQTLTSYQNMSRADQKRIDRLIAFDYLTQVYKDNPSLKSADNQAYKSLNSQEEKYIKILTMDLRGDELSTAEQALLSSAYSYYYNVAPGRKATLNRIVADALFSAYKQGDNYRMISSDATYRNNMDESAKSMLANIKAFRYNNERILSENLEIESLDLGDRQVVLNIPSYTNRAFNRLNIAGRLIDTQTGNPVTTKALRIVDQSGVMIAKTFTGTDGSFKFNDIRAGNYHIEVDQPSNISSQNESYFVKDLEITGTQGVAYDHQKTFNIYYDFNDHKLRPEAKQALFDLVELAENQEISIEMKAHTDAIGNIQYNDELSGKRGASAMDFLTGFGIDPDKISLLAYGKSDPVASNTDEYGRQFNRRVEVTIKSQQPIRYTPPTVYLIRPKATLYSISKNFNLTVEELKKLNGLDQTGIRAYRPIRILNPANYKPNLDMLVELNESVSTSNSFKYVVKSQETITSIAEKFNLPEELLLEMNGLTTQNLNKGQILNIYVRY